MTPQFDDFCTVANPKNAIAPVLKNGPGAEVRDES